ncbi:MAG: PH domain-containing protein [Anaerolineaceae bacterium]|nr:PH domain-containing protein [Anaerolineaceae bacterium]
MNDPYLQNLLGNREKILLVTHQHWFVLLRNILFELLLIIATLIAVTLVMMIWLPLPTAALGYMLLIIPVVSLIKDTLIWRNHKYVVTSRRVIQIFGLLNKNVTDSSLEKVNDVKMEQSALGRMFNFGDIEILTASELGINRFTFIGDPIRFKTEMINAKFELEQGDYHPGTSQPTLEIPRLIEQLDALRKHGAITESEFQEKKARLLARL